MRNVLDPKRHYKKDGKKFKIPDFCHQGTIVEGPTEFYSARMHNAERKKTLADEILAQNGTIGRFTSKYNDLQSSKASGKRAYYKSLKEKRFKAIRKRSVA